MITGYRLDNAEEQVQVKTDNTSRKQVNLTALVVKIKEGNNYNDLTITAYEIGEYHNVEGIGNCIDIAIDKLGIWVDRWSEDIAEHHLNFIYNIPSSSDIHLGKLQGGAITLDTCNTAMCISNNLATKIEVVTEKKGIDKLTINGEVLKTRVKPCQQH